MLVDADYGARVDEELRLRTPMKSN